MTDVASGDSLVEQIEPSSTWTEDPSYHYLLVDIPGFKKEWLKVQLDDRGHILVKGEKQTEDKIIQFKQRFKLPENSDAEKIRGKYDGGILYVTVPKLVEDKEMESLKTATDDNIRGKRHEPKHDQEEHDKQHEHHQEEHDKKHELHQEEQGEKHEHEHHEEGHEGERHSSHHGQIVEEGGFLEGGILGSIKEILYKNKGIAVTTVLALALGMLLSQKFQSNGGSEGHLPPM